MIDLVKTVFYCISIPISRR